MNDCTADLCLCKILLSLEVANLLKLLLSKMHNVLQ